MINAPFPVPGDTSNTWGTALQSFFNPYFDLTTGGLTGLVGVVTPQMFGGGPGKSTAVNNAAIASAITLALSSNAPLYFSAGTWDYSATIWFQAGNVHMFGAGIGLTVLRPSGWIDAVRAADSLYPNAATTLLNVYIHDFTIDGVNQLSGANDTFGNGINLNAVDAFFVQRIGTLNVANQHIINNPYILDKGIMKKAIIDSCYVDGVAANQVGIGTESAFSFISLTNNHVVNNSGTGLLISGGGNGLTTTGRAIASHNMVQGATGGTGIGIVVADITNRVLVNNNLTQGMDIGIRMYASHGLGSVQDILVSSNETYDWTSGGIFIFPVKSGDDSFAQVNGNTIKSSFASGTSKGLYLDKGGTAQANKIYSGATGIFCVNGGQKLLSNDIVGPTVSVDTATSASTGVIARGNVVDTAPNLNSDTVWEWPGGYGGQIASAAGIAIPLNGSLFQITGTTTIQAFNNLQVGKTITLEFAGILTVQNGNDLVLNGNFTTQAGSTLTLVCVGSNWYEVARRL